MTKVLWFSRHPMTSPQRSALEAKLGEVDLTQVDGTAANIHVPFKAKVNGGEEQDMVPLKELITDFDVAAIVLPIGLQQQLLGVSGDKPVIFAKNSRLRNPDGEFEFVFEAWDRLIKIDIVTEPFA